MNRRSILSLIFGVRRQPGLTAEEQKELLKSIAVTIYVRDQTSDGSIGVNLLAFNNLPEEIKQYYETTASFVLLTVNVHIRDYDLVKKRETRHPRYYRHPVSRKVIKVAPKTT